MRNNASNNSKFGKYNYMYVYESYSKQSDNGHKRSLFTDFDGFSDTNVSRTSHEIENIWSANFDNFISGQCSTSGTKCMSTLTIDCRQFENLWCYSS